ncbi:polysaccharide biosynthesis/export family protein [Anthocerotibacter panamensis]|uniref:polysaccharide biosynthesis/export family protein n=1 Tax=Anthocerotibacter panamensis TaxID=2857077 RepID=UPI001C402317|nr:polysaccharide biosynthesis/export family protein [Anthocerotibacter panamensis]
MVSVRRWTWGVVPLLVMLGTVASAGANTLSAYDRVSVAVVDGEEFSSARGGMDEGFVIGADGMLAVPQLGGVPAAGREEADLQQDLTRRLSAYIRVPNVAVRLVGVSPVTVEVSGAVYRPGAVTLQPEAVTVRDVSALRTAFNAVRKAGGIRPDANLAGIVVERAGKQQTLALGQDTPVIQGDRILVPSLGAGQEQNNVPAQLAPTEITVYVSGQDLPATSIGPVKVKPGTSLFGALTAAGATGQSFLRSGRSVLFIRHNPVDGKREVQTLALDRIVRGETDPKLLDGDSIAIDSGPTANAGGLLNLLAPLLSPLIFLFR